VLLARKVVLVFGHGVVKSATKSRHIRLIVSRSLTFCTTLWHAGLRSI
jgi:thiamine pyrophosphate-dependent acetolactate synthase large subunit-like protein